MALLSFSAAPAKGDSVSLTLDKATLFGLSPLIADAYWGDEGNVSRLLVHFTSGAGSQRKLLTFYIEDTTPQCSLHFSISADDSFELSMITLVDYDGGSLTLDRAALLSAIPTLSSMDIDLAL